MITALLKVHHYVDEANGFSSFSIQLLKVLSQYPAIEFPKKTQEEIVIIIRR